MIAPYFYVDKLSQLKHCKLNTSDDRTAAESFVYMIRKA